MKRSWVPQPSPWSERSRFRRVLSSFRDANWRRLNESLVPPISVALLFGLIVALAYLNTGGALNSPDDASNFATARELVRQGHPWLEIPGGLTDEFDLLHPRGFVTLGGRAVPIQSLTTPGLHALVWVLSGTFAVSAGLFSAFGLFGWVVAGRELLRKSWMQALILCLLTMPILYWLTRQYFSMSTYLLFMPWTMVAVHRSLLRDSSRFAIVGGILHGIALTARPDLLFAHAVATPLIACAALSLRRDPTSLLRLAGLFVMSGGVVFVIIVLGTNAWLIGDPLTFGYDIARSNPGFDQPLEVGTGIELADSLLARLFPFGISDLNVIGEMSYRYTIELSPVLITFAIAGLLAVLRAGDRRTGAIVLLGVLTLACYVAVSRSSLNLQGSTAMDPLPSHSLVRYFMPLSIVAWFFAGIGTRLVSTPDARVRSIATLGMIVGLTLSIWQVFFAFNGVSLLSWSQTQGDRHSTFAQIFGSTESDAIIVSPTYDKFAIANGRASLSWMTVGENAGFRPTDVAVTVAAAMASGTPVYIWDTSEVGEPLMRELCSRGLWLEQQQPRFYAVIQDPACSDRLLILFRD